jgi:hypothetical protein
VARSSHLYQRFYCMQSKDKPLTQVIVRGSVGQNIIALGLDSYHYILQYLLHLLNVEIEFIE